MVSPRTVKEVQKLIRRIAAFNRFVSRVTDKCLPFFKTLKQAFAWANECEVAFQELKHYLSNPPLLSPSKGGGKLILILGLINHSSECSLDSWRSQKTAPGLLRQLSLLGGWVQLPKDREDCIRVNSSLMQITAVLSSEPYPGNDEPTYQKVHEQTWGSRKNGSVGNQA